MTYELESFYYHCSVQPRRKTKLSAAAPLNQSPHDKSSVEGGSDYTVSCKCTVSAAQDSKSMLVIRFKAEFHDLPNHSDAAAPWMKRSSGRNVNGARCDSSFRNGQLSVAPPCSTPHPIRCSPPDKEQEAHRTIAHLHVSDRVYTAGLIGPKCIPEALKKSFAPLFIIIIAFYSHL